MPDLSTVSPLMQSIHWQGEDYYASQYFHQQYRAKSQYGGKYKRHDSFMRTMRSIPAYALYVEQGAIVELAWTALKLKEPQMCGYFQPLFRAVGYKPLTLLNATAQVALTHHLDDALSPSKVFSPLHHRKPGHVSSSH
jgi:hypothetical protein